ncbi:MAG: ATP-binding protein [Bryobacteraceae bacterium]
MPEIVVGDPTRLRQIAVNLIANAIKFTEKGEVALEVTTEANHEQATILYFVVRDTGVGIPSEKKEVIFEASTQVDSSTARKYGGTGLGLTISSRLVRAMGGRIWVALQRQAQLDREQGEESRSPTATGQRRQMNVGSRAMRRWLADNRLRVSAEAFC